MQCEWVATATQKDLQLVDVTPTRKTPGWVKDATQNVKAGFEKRYEVMQSRQAVLELKFVTVCG